MLNTELFQPRELQKLPSLIKLLPSFKLMLHQLTDLLPYHSVNEKIIWIIEIYILIFKELDVFYKKSIF